MACSLESQFCVSGLNESMVKAGTKGLVGFCSSFYPSRFQESKAKSFPKLGTDFGGKPIILSDQRSFIDESLKVPNKFFIQVQASICTSRAMKWWEKTLAPNMVEIHSAQVLVDSLLTAGDELVIVDFYSPSCGGCKTLHPKICQLAESHPKAIFLKVNHEELKNMCDCLHIHVLPFFRFYRGAEGRLCSFSCTNGTIHKFKNALARHGADRCSIGPAKGLDHSEHARLATLGELSINLPLPLPLQTVDEERVEDLVVKNIDLPGLWSKTAPNKLELKQESLVV
ncbi:thioredoxin-like 1-2, chloroplastic isoform X2 [Tripterygium wilfordii]|uniref:thioredoxin-like 1-2, chloroplastic isoform X2 n=1 Tax=Tripterygium wilfordii TaxID=458696 RepID=UPI0018F817EE|nr:thioredoxin-like 1-2, chloroplastic isoform X2 [Tripterygium wilfordii]